MGNLFGEVCENGHLVSYGEVGKGNSCKICGGQSIVYECCPYCKKPIAVGEIAGGLSFPNTCLPKKCIFCKEGFPWFTKAYEAYVIRLKHDTKLNTQDKEYLFDLLQATENGKPDFSGEKDRFQHILSKAEVRTKNSVCAYLSMFVTDTCKMNLGL